LQLPLAALQERIDQELVENPVIEMRETRPEENPGAAAEPAAATTDADGERDLVVKDDGGPEDFQRLSDLVDRWENYFEETRPRRPRRAADGPDPKMEAMQNTPDVGQTLQEYLLDEWRLEDADPRLGALGEAIVRSLDDNGYLRSPLEDLAGEVEPPATPDELEDALRRIQAVGPAGVGARDLTECLLLQLAAHPVYGGGPGRLPGDAPEVRIIRDHLRDVGANRYPRMAKALGVTIDEVKRAVERIQRLNPKPGAAISPQRTPPIMPDVHIRWDEEAGEYVVTIEGRDTPELYVSKAYRRMVKQRDLEEKTRRFVAKNIRSARWLMDAIQQRRDTLQRVTESIVRFQRPFFDDGPDHVQPLKMQQVADDVGLHVGTISRAVSDKYADTPWGIWALRAFFMGGTETADGEEVSWDRVRVHLKKIVEAEDKRKPLSDQAIARSLKDQGIDVARRTVAKYREEMDIPSSRRRRQY
ncbi:MAG: RNA polymerase factor sigma-54, partial [Planctomycetota bacterium]|nr:RNA polymerase factor sigma-54 [Planctomycetota bacterium]